jgi:hypothetical protein
MADHLAKLDGLAVRGCADKFFSAYSARWGSRMPRRSRDLETYFTALDMEGRTLGLLESEERMDWIAASLRRTPSSHPQTCLKSGGTESSRPSAMCAVLNPLRDITRTETDGSMMHRRSRSTLRMFHFANFERWTNM